MQVISNVAQDGSHRLPQALQSLYRGVALLQLQGVTLPPSCISGYPFSTQLATLGVAVGVWLIAFALALASHRLPGRAWRPVVVLCISVAVYLHPTTTSATVTLLNCRSVQLSASAVAALQDSWEVDSSLTTPSVDFSATAALKTVSVVESNPFVPCFGRLHAPAGGFAAVVLFAYLLAMPVLTYVWLLRDERLARELRAKRLAELCSIELPPSAEGKARRRSSNVIIPVVDEGGSADSSVYCKSTPEALTPPTDPALQTGTLPRADPLLFPFLSGSDYCETAWFWRHVDLCIVCSLSVVNAALPIPTTLIEVRAEHGGSRNNDSPFCKGCNLPSPD